MKDVDRNLEPRLTNVLFSKASQKKVPLSGTFELSPVCNFSCEMCYVRKSVDEVRNHERKILTKDQWLEIARQAKSEGMLYLLLTGGEPFLWEGFWDLYEELSHMGFLISINSNGSLIDEKVVQKLKDIPPTRINITLYGASDDTYENLCHTRGVFSKVDQAITKLQQADIAVKLNGSLTPANVNDLENCVDYAKKKGLIYETNTYMFPPVRREPDAIGCNERFTPKEAAYYNAKSYRAIYGEEMYWKRMEAIVQGAIPPPGLDESCVDPIDGRIRCRAGKASFWITWDGWMTPCGMMPEPQIDITKGTFRNNWKLLTEVSGKLNVSGICVKCPNQKLCHSCAAMALTETGSTERIPIYLCEMVKEMKYHAVRELSAKKERISKGGKKENEKA